MYIQIHSCSCTLSYFKVLSKLCPAEHGDILGVVMNNRLIK